MLILAVWLPFVAAAAETDRRSHDGSLEGWVTAINREALYIDGQEYRMSGSVRVFIGSENGWEINLNTIADVGRIDKAKVYLGKGLVERIVILEVQQ